MAENMSTLSDSTSVWLELLQEEVDGVVVAMTCAPAQVARRWTVRWYSFVSDRDKEQVRIVKSLLPQSVCDYPLMSISCCCLYHDHSHCDPDASPPDVMAIPVDACHNAAYKLGPAMPCSHGVGELRPDHSIELNARDHNLQMAKTLECLSGVGAIDSQV